MTAPLTRTARHARIAELIGTRPVHSQTELADLLAAEGVQVTQATLSRDLEELRAVKVRSGDGPASAVFDQAENRLHAQKALLAWLVTRDAGGAA